MALNENLRDPAHPHAWVRGGPLQSPCGPPGFEALPLRVAGPLQTRVPLRLDGSYRFQTRVALPETTFSRSSAGTPSNMLFTISRERGQLETGCG